MEFVSSSYLIFLVSVFFVYWHMRYRFQNLFLLIASWTFYGCWDWRFLSLIIISTAVDFMCGERIYRSSTLQRRRAWLLVSVFVNLGVLGYFKYANFFLDSFVSLSRVLGWHLSKTTLEITLPVGISFYTFQSISYTLDIYGEKLKPTKSFVDFATFVAFFPQLVAGPIVRAREFLFQLEEKRRFRGKDLEKGCIRLLTGYFKKAFIADTLGLYLVDPVFAAPGSYSEGMLWLAMVGYAVQIYADFSGYSSMAIGSARILGFRLPENFVIPYLATNFSEFWTRWHITMSRFFRDYVYIPLGGSRCSKPRVFANLAVTTLTSGLWHGANWTFVIWGGLHGLFIIVNHIFRASTYRDESCARETPWRVLCVIPFWFGTQLLVCLAWILFRSADFGTAWIYLKGLVGFGGEAVIELPLLVWSCFIAFIVDHFSIWLGKKRPQLGEKLPTMLTAMGYAVMVVFLCYSVPDKGNPFIYFQF